MVVADPFIAESRLPSGRTRLASKLELVSKILVEADGRFAALHAKRSAVFDREWNRQLDHAALRSLSDQVSAVEPEEYHALHELLDQVCDHYLQCGPEEREALRLSLGMRRDVLQEMLNHVGWAASHVASPQDHLWVLRGLAAASLQDHRLDFRDVYVALGDLYLTAVGAGIDASLCFQDVAAMSNPHPGRMARLGAMRDFLRKFEESAFFAESVRPRLPQVN
jgi:hypothetical protein